MLCIVLFASIVFLVSFFSVVACLRGLERIGSRSRTLAAVVLAAAACWWLLLLFAHRRHGCRCTPARHRQQQRGQHSLTTRGQGHTLLTCPDGHRTARASLASEHGRRGCSEERTGESVDERDDLENLSTRGETRREARALKLRLGGGRRARRGEERSQPAAREQWGEGGCNRDGIRVCSARPCVSVAAVARAIGSGTRALCKDAFELRSQAQLTA